MKPENQKEFDILSIKYEVLLNEYKSITNSNIWKITKPYRILADSIKTATGKKKRANFVMKFAWKLRHGYHLPEKAFKISENKRNFAQNLKFSIILPIYNPSKKHFLEAIGSVLFQTYQNWELCIVDGNEESKIENFCLSLAKSDKRIIYTKISKTEAFPELQNAGIEQSTGDFISLLEQDAILHPDALYETMKVICETNAKFIYTDEACFKKGNLHSVSSTNFKPDFAKDYFLSTNYIGHFVSFEKTLLNKTGLFNGNLAGAHEYDLFLKLTEQTDKIAHVQKCLYYSRKHKTFDEQNESRKLQAGLQALKEHFSRCSIKAEVSPSIVPLTYKIDYPIIGNPVVSIIIPTYEHWQTLKNCIDSIKKLSTYKNYEILIVENNSTSHETFAYYDSLKNDSKIKMLYWKDAFNYSAINNFAFRKSKGEHIILLNNDIEIISPNWIEEMLMFSQRSDVGAVGAKLYFPNGKIQHGGDILALGGVAGHSHFLYDKQSSGYANRLVTVQNYTCVTAACLMTQRKVYEEMGGLDEFYQIALNDVDFCLRLREKGYTIIWTPFAEMYHNESSTRGKNIGVESRIVQKTETARLKKRWCEEFKTGDPFYNPNLAQLKTNFSVIGEIF